MTFYMTADVKCTVEQKSKSYETHITYRMALIHYYLQLTSTI